MDHSTKRTSTPRGISGATTDGSQRIQKLERAEPTETGYIIPST